MSDITFRMMAPVPSTIRDDDRSVEFVASTEAPVMVFDPRRFDFIPEVLIQSGMKLPSNRQVPLLNSHNQDGVENVLGSMRDFRLVDGQTIGRAFFSRRGAAVDAFQDVRDAHITDLSVGYRVNKAEWVKDGETRMISGRSFQGPVQVVTDWALHEVSLCAIGADPGAKARAQAQEIKSDPGHKAEKPMEEKMEDHKPNTPTPVEPGINADEIRAQAIKAENDRLLKVRQMCKVPGCEDLEAQLSDPSVTLDKAREIVISRMAEKAKPLSTPRIEGGLDEKTKFRKAAADAMLMKTSCRASMKEVAPGADQLSRMGFHAIAQECLRQAGHDPRFMGKEDMLSLALNRRTSGNIPGQGTSDFDYILADAANKAMMVGFNTAPQTYKAWCSIGSNPDFKASRRVRLSDAPNLVATAEGAEVTFGYMSDSGESVTLATYARKLGISRQALVNDDLGCFDSIFKAFGFRAQNLINSLPYALLIANGNLADGGALFNTTAVSTTGGHANIATAAAAITSTSVNVGTVAMFAQVGPNGSKLGLLPKFLLTGGSAMSAAQILTGSLALPDATYSAGVKNPYNVLLPIADANITLTKWFLVADPAIAPTVEVAFLDGKETPTLTQEDTTNILGVEYTAFIDATAKALDFRGIFYNAGA